MSTQQQTTVIESIASEHNNNVSTVEDMSDEICGIHINDQYIYQPRNGEWIWYVHKNKDYVQSVSIFFSSVSYNEESIHLKHDGTTTTILQTDDYSQTFQNLLRKIANNTA